MGYMETAIQLLLTAQMLLSMVLGTPNIPGEFKNNAINIANNAISVANAEISKQSAIPTGNTIGTQVEEISTELTTSYRKSGEHWIVRVSVLENGNNLKNAPIRMVAEDNLLKEDFYYNKITNSHTYNTDDWYAEFTYIPTESKNSATFYYGDITKIINF